MAELPRDRIYVGLGGHVLAVEASSGREVWRTKLVGRDFVSTMMADGRVIAGTRGRLYSLDPVTGAILWENGMKGLGYGLISLPGTEGAASAEAAAMKAQRQRQAAAAAG